MNDRCVYCGSQQDLTKEHVPARLFLEKPYPKNLKTIQACKSCNSGFSKHEEYLLNVFVEISSNAALLAKKESGGTVFKARVRSTLLRERIWSSLIHLHSGLIYFAPEYERVSLVLEKTAIGLYFSKYNKTPKSDHFKFIGFYPYSIQETRPADAILSTFTESFLPKKWSVVQPNVFSYIVVRYPYGEQG
jgi:hypothetical protein